jgi:hypothetical protein
MEFDLTQHLRIIDTGLVLPFEDPPAGTGQDEHSRPEISLIRHPLPVSVLDNGCYLLLEDSANYRSLLESGLGHLPVQLCAATNISFPGRTLGLVNFDCDDLTRFVAKHPDQITLLEKADADHGAGGYISIGIDFTTGPSFILRLRNSSRTGCPNPLEQLVRTILTKGRIVPLAEKTPAFKSRTCSLDTCGIMSLPDFALADLASAATSDRLYPFGLIRPRIRSRILNIDFPLSVLRSDSSLDDKNGFLNDLLSLRQRNSRVVWYEGRVYLLNQ